jgi:hypothetical protein
VTPFRSVRRHVRAEQTLGQPVLTKWWMLKVRGLLPGRPTESGELVTEVSA